MFYTVVVQRSHPFQIVMPFFFKDFVSSTILLISNGSHIFSFIILYLKVPTITAETSLAMFHSLIILSKHL